MTETANKGTPLFEKLLGLVRDAYEGVTEDDYQNVIDFLAADPSGRCAGMVQELKQLGAGAIRERILQEFRQVTDEERTRTPDKIQRVLEASPLIAAAFDSDVLWTLIEQRYNKRCLVEKFRQHPEMLYRLDASSSASASSSSSSDADETSAVATSPAHMADPEPARTETAGNVEMAAEDSFTEDDDDREEEEEEEEAELPDSDDIVWDLFGFVAERFAEAFTTAPTAMGPQDSCHFQGNW